MFKAQKELVGHLTGGRLNGEELTDLCNYIDSLLMPREDSEHTLIHFNHIAPEIADEIVIFKIGTRYYPATKNNYSAFYAFCQTNESIYLAMFDGEVEL